MGDHLKWSPRTKYRDLKLSVIRTTNESSAARGMLVNGEPKKLRKHKGKYHSQLILLACNLFSHRCVNLSMDLNFYVY
jgi:hypothetical protein